MKHETDDTDILAEESAEREFLSATQPREWINGIAARILTVNGCTLNLLVLDQGNGRRVLAESLEPWNEQVRIGEPCVLSAQRRPEWPDNLYELAETHSIGRN